jgi:hypothetical protein
MIGAKAVFAPDKAKDVATWFREVGKDDAKLIVITRT